MVVGVNVWGGVTGVGGVADEPTRKTQEKEEEENLPTMGLVGFHLS